MVAKTVKKRKEFVKKRRGLDANGKQEFLSFSLDSAAKCPYFYLD
jgi:hypothetical protein